MGKKLGGGKKVSEIGQSLREGYDKKIKILKGKERKSRNEKNPSREQSCESTGRGITRKAAAR